MNFQPYLFLLLALRSIFFVGDKYNIGGNNRYPHPAIDIDNTLNSNNKSPEDTNFIPYENVYVINLNSRPDRLAFMTEILNEIEQPFTRIEAVNGKEIPQLCIENRYSLHPKIVYSCGDYKRDMARKKCLNGEIGCWLSHLKIYFQIVENYENTGRDNPTLILEDDIDVEHNFKKLMKDSISQLPLDWEMFYPGYFMPWDITILGDNIAKVGNFWGTFSQVVRNAEVAKKLIALANKKECQIADHFNLNAMKRDELIAYHAYPEQYVSFHSKLGQDIEHWNTKDSPEWVFKLKQSTYDIIHKRKENLLSNNNDSIEKKSDSKPLITNESDVHLNSFSGNPEHKTYENVYVINLNSHPNKLSFTTEILIKIKQPFTRIEAINGIELLELCKEKPISIHPEILYSCEDFVRDNKFNKCLNAEIGRWLSHVKVHFQIVENHEKTGKDNPTLILEDDVDLELDFEKLVQEAISHLPPDWEIFYPGYFFPNEITIINPIIAKIGKFLGTFSYVVRNAEVAKKLIALGNKRECLITDHYNIEQMERKELISYHAYPKQFANFHTNLRQDIEHDLLNMNYIDLENSKNLA